MAFGWYLTGQLPGTCAPPQCMHRFVGLENLSTCCCSGDGSIGPVLKGHRAGTCPSFLHFPQNGGLCEIRYIRVVPSLTLGLVWLFLVVANRADLAVLAQDLGEMRRICWVRGQFLLLSDPGKTPLPVRIARNLRHSRVPLANGVKFAQFASNSFYLSAKD